MKNPIDLKEVAQAIYSRIEDYERDENQVFLDDSIPFGEEPYFIFINMRIDANYDCSSQSRPDIKELQIWNSKNDIEDPIELSNDLYDIEELLYELLSNDVELESAPTPRSKRVIQSIFN